MLRVPEHPRNLGIQIGTKPDFCLSEFSCYSKHLWIWKAIYGSVMDGIVCRKIEIIWLQLINVSLYNSHIFLNLWNKFEKIGHGPVPLEAIFDLLLTSRCIGNYIENQELSRGSLKARPEELSRERNHDFFLRQAPKKQNPVWIDPNIGSWVLTP